MRKLGIILMLLLAALTVNAQVTLISGQNAVPVVYGDGSTSAVNMMYIYLPWDYFVTTKKYATIFFWTGNNGVGNGGSDLPKLLTQDLPYQVDNGHPPYSVNGTDTTWFIVTCYQPSSTTGITSANLSDWVGTLQNLGLRVDSSHLYFIGASQGAGDMMKFPTGSNGWKPAAMAPACPYFSMNLTLLKENMENMPAWFFQADNDAVVGTTPTTYYTNLTDAYPDGDYKLTTFSGPHSGTSRTSDFAPDWNDLSSSNVVSTDPSAGNTSIYTWLLQFSIVVKPDVNPGSTQNLPYGTTSTTLTGSASSLNGNITSYQWTTTSGATIVSPNSATTEVTGLEGSTSYTFTLTATDDSGKTSSADVIVNIGSYTGPVKKVKVDFSGQSTWNVFQWNNFKNNSTSTGLISNLVDSTGAGTGISLQLTSTFTGVTSQGQTTGDNSGIFKDSVLQRGFYVASGKVGTLQFSGLDDTKDYTFVFVGSSASTSASHITVFDAGSVKDSVEARSNTSSAATFTLKPTSGVINIDVKEGTGATNGYLNGLTVEYADSTEAPPSTDTADYQILVDSSAAFHKGDTIFYNEYDINSADGSPGATPYALFDEQTLETPVTNFTSGFSSQVYYPTQVVVDLGGFYKITKLQYYVNFGNDSLNFLYGIPLNWNTDTIRVGTNGQGWKTVSDTFYTRYLKVYYSNDFTSQKVNEVRIFGHLVSDSLSRGLPPYTPTFTTNTMGDFMGFNQIGPANVDSVGTLWRHYMNYEWADTVTTTHNIDSIKFVFSKFGEPDGVQNLLNYYFPGGPDTDTIQTGYTGRWGEILDAFQGTPQFLIDMGYPEFAKPIDPITHPGRDSTDVNSYDRVSRLAYTYAQTWGKNTFPPDSVQTPYPDKTGLAERNYVETGNEFNKNWSGTQGYWSPEVFAKYSSAIYDGDLGKMGTRMGFKVADPSMTVVAGATAGMYPNYLKMLYYYFYYGRADHSIAYDANNFHFYPTNGVNGENTTGLATSPEDYYYSRQDFHDYINLAKRLMPDKPVWITEWGYDRDPRSPIKVGSIPGKDSAQVQADWTARMWFLLSFSGIDRSTIFQLVGNVTGEFGGVKFNTMGLVDGTYLGDAEHDFSHNYFAFPVYYYQRTIWLKLYNYRPDSIVYDNHDSIWVYRYRNVNSPDSVAYAIWSGTQTNRSVNTYSIKTGHASTVASLTKLEDKEFLGTTTTPTSDANGEIPLVINETPQLLFTTEGTDGGQLVTNGEPVNNPPTADAGPDQSLAYTATTTTLSGSGTDTDGTIVSYAWTKVSGPTCTITDPSSATTGVTGLTSGSTYVFKLTVTDDGGLTGSDNVTIVVAAAPNTPPTANAGNDQSLSSGTTSTTLNGTGTGNDGATISSYAWTQMSGDATIVSPSSQNTSITGLQDGHTYTFRLTVTDNHGLTGNDDVTVTVADTPVTPGNLKFKWVYYIDDYVILIFEDQNTGKLYSIKLKNQ